MNATGRYILYKKVARGGMAEIFLGKQIGQDGFQRICGIKRILPHYANDQEFIKMFRDEAHICKRLQHANIVRVEGFEQVEGSYAIIMEFIDGADIRTILASCEKSSSRLSPAMAVFIVAEAARGLHYAHTKIDEITHKPMEIVHRDISPQNILVSFEGEVKVTDFGIADADADAKATETKPGIVKGKYSYMSPEQISAQPVDGRTDVFALTIVLWEMLAMRRLFQGENEVMTIQMVRNCQINHDLQSLNDQVDDDLMAIIHRGLQKDARDRYASAAALEKDLRRYLGKFYPDFTAEDLGNHLKQLMAARRQESQENIKRLLSEQVPESNLNNIQLSQTAPTSESSPQLPASQTQMSQASSSQMSHSQTTGRVAGSGLQNPPQKNSGFHRPQAAPPQSNLNRMQTNFNRSQQQRRDAYRHKVQRQRQRKKGPPLLTIFMFAMLMIGAGAYVIYQKQVLDKVPITLEIRTTPAVVRVKLDGKPIEGHRYIKTPLTIKKIQKGNHVLSFSRQGFAEESIQLKVDGKQKNMLTEVVLKQLKQMAPVRLSFISPIEQNVKILMDDGIVSETLSTSDSLNLEYITFGDQHVLTVIPTQEGERFRCRFVPRAQNWRAPYLVVVHFDDNRCRYPLR